MAKTHRRALFLLICALVALCMPLCAQRGGVQHEELHGVQCATWYVPCESIAGIARVELQNTSEKVQSGTITIASHSGRRRRGGMRGYARVSETPFSLSPADSATYEFHIGKHDYLDATLRVKGDRHSLAIGNSGGSEYSSIGFAGIESEGNSFLPRSKSSLRALPLDAQVLRLWQTIVVNTRAEWSDDEVEALKKASAAGIHLILATDFDDQESLRTMQALLGHPLSRSNFSKDASQIEEMPSSGLSREAILLRGSGLKSQRRPVVNAPGDFRVVRYDVEGRSLEVVEIDRSHNPIEALTSMLRGRADYGWSGSQLAIPTSAVRIAESALLPVIAVVLLIALIAIAFCVLPYMAFRRTRPQWLAVGLCCVAVVIAGVIFIVKETVSSGVPNVSELHVIDVNDSGHPVSLTSLAQIRNADLNEQIASSEGKYVFRPNDEISPIAVRHGQPVMSVDEAATLQDEVSLGVFANAPSDLSGATFGIALSGNEVTNTGSKAVRGGIVSRRNGILLVFEAIEPGDSITGREILRRDLGAFFDDLEASLVARGAFADSEDFSRESRFFTNGVAYLFVENPETISVIKSDSHRESTTLVRVRLQDSE